MKTSMYQKLQSLVERHQELALLMGDPEIIQQQDKFRAYSKEYADLEDLVSKYQAYQHVLEQMAHAEESMKDEDPEVRELAQEEYYDAKQRKTDLEEQLKLALLPKDPDDDKNVYLEIRAGTGGDEAAIFSGDLFRMYTRYAESKNWHVEVLSVNPGDHGGYKEIIAYISGEQVYAYLKFESGAHRVQRVPETESGGRIHTSACTVAVMPEADAIEEETINPADLRVDTFRSSGAGGQHVNTTDSAVRITHLPSGIVVECQEERSQHKNRAKAMAYLQTKLYESQRQQQQQKQAETRKSLVGTGDRSDRIRTYNFPQSRVTEHRIQLTLYKLNHVMEGELDKIIESLVREQQAEQLAQFSD